MVKFEVVKHRDTEIKEKPGNEREWRCNARYQTDLYYFIAVHLYLGVSGFESGITRNADGDALRSK